MYSTQLHTTVQACLVPQGFLKRFSLGVGRTGTLILMYICARMAVTSSQLDLRGILERIRTQRPKLVETYVSISMMMLFKIARNCLEIFIK